MDDYVDNMVDTFKNKFGRKIKPYDTPGEPGKHLKKNGDETMMLDEYRSIVGKLIYYSTKISPDCSNAVRELSQHMSNPGEQHWKALDRIIGYVSNKKNNQIIYNSPKEMVSISYSDSNYASDTDDRKSISGIVNTIGGMLTSWTSKKQPSVTLSTTEAEYVAISVCAQESIFQNKLLKEIGV